MGLKSFKIGGAKVSEIHANWIVNHKNATGLDILELIRLIKSQVKQKFNITLKEEVEII